MAKQMVTLKLDPEQASLTAVKEKLGLKPAQIDEGFGVIDVSPQEHLYAIMIDEDAAAAVSDLPEVEGTFSNPKIEPLDAG